MSATSSRLRSAAVAAAAILVIAAAAWLARGPLLRGTLQVAVALLTGYNLQIGDLRLDRSHIVLRNVHVRRRGDPVLDVTEIDVDYSLRDLLPGGKRAYGLRSVAVIRPHFYLVRRSDGSFNISIPRGKAKPPAEGATPLIVNARVSDGAIDLVDPRNLVVTARRTQIVNLNVEASVDTARLTRYRVDAQVADGARLYPIHAQATIDQDRRYAMHHISAAAIPLRGMGNFLINSHTAQLETGSLRDLDVRLYSLDLHKNAPSPYHLAGGARLADVTMRMNVLTRPARDIAATIAFDDDAIVATRLSGFVGPAHMTGAGGMYDFSNPQFRLAVLTRDDLRDLHLDFNFLRRVPLAGELAATTVLEGPLTKPLILAHASGAELRYGTIPVRGFRATIAYNEGVVFTGDVAGSVGGVHARVAARFLTGGKDVDALMALAADAAPGEMPYMDRIAPRAATHMTLTGAGIGFLLDTHGVLTALGPSERVTSLFSLSPRGVGELGPFTLAQRGGSVNGAFVIDRERGTSALWADARHLTLHPGRASAVLPGVRLPEFPPIAGQFDGKFAGIDIDRRLVLFGEGSTHDGVFMGVPIADARADFAGPIDRLALGAIDAHGEFGHFAGRGGFGAGSFMFAGTLDGTLQGMRRWTGDLGAVGGIHGPVAIVSRNGRTLVQTPGVGLHDASVHRVPLRDLAGTFLIEPARIDVFGATADLGGGRVVARGNSRDGIRLSTAGIDAAALRGAGLPLDRGTLVGSGDLRLGTGTMPSFDGSLALAGGRVKGRRIDASAELAYSGDALRLGAGAFAVSRAFGFLDGTVRNVAANPAYDLHANLAYADLRLVNSALPVKIPYLTGTVQADVHVSGSGLSPYVLGAIRVPEGSVNGLNFSDVRTEIAYDRGGISAGGTAMIGSTRAAFGGVERQKITSFSLDSDSANLGDFNDFFPVAETLDGRGSVHLNFLRRSGEVFSNGSVDLEGLRYRNFAFGHAAGNWNSTPGKISGKLSVTGRGGSLDAQGTVSIPHGTRLIRLATASDVDLHASVKGADLSVWLPALGYLAPVGGFVDATTTAKGRYPAVVLDFDGQLRSGMIGRIPIDRLHVSAGSDGGRDQIRSLDLSIAGVDVRGNGSFGLRGNDKLAMDFDATTDRLGDFVRRIAGQRYGLDGAGNVHVAVRGTVSRPSADASFLLRPLRVWSLAIPSVLGSLSVDRERLALEDATISLPTGKITLAGSLPLVAGPTGIPRATPLSFDLGMQGVALDQFAVLAPAGTALQGEVGGLVRVRGTIGEPTLAGSIDLTGGGYSGPVETQPIAGVNASLVFDQTTATLSRFEGTIGGGKFSGRGQLRIPPGGGGGRPSYDADVSLEAVRVAFPGYGSARADGAISLRRPAPDSATVGGQLTVSDASIALAAFMKAAGPAATPGFALAGLSVPGPSIAAAAFALPAWAESLGLDLKIVAGNAVRIRSPIMDMGTKGALQIAGTVGAPSLDGELDATPGGSLFLNRPFKVQDARVRFTPQNGISPDLYARATTQIAQAAGLQPIDVTVTAQGLIPDIRLSYASDPPFDEATIVGLLFGANSLGASVGSINSFAPSTNILLPPNAFQQTPAGTFALSQEAANLINAQFTARLLAPIEQGLGTAFGLSDLAINLAPTGSVGVQARRLLGRNTSALYGTSLTYPYRMTFGLESRPDANTSVIFTAFTQQGLYSFSTVKPDAYLSANPLLGSAADVGGTQGFTVNVQRRFR